MAIGYARWDFVKRSAGKNMVVKAAYNSRSRIEFYGNVVSGAKVYDYSYREAPVFNAVLLPRGVDQKFLSSQILWNACESKEVRVNSQTGFEGVLALPDDGQVSVENRLELAKTFLDEQFVEKGLAVQLDIHQPDKIFTFTKDCAEFDIKSGESGKLLKEEKGEYIVGIQKGNNIDRTISFDPKKFKDFQYSEHNWHAHFLVTSRRFTSNGKELGKKARDMMPQLRSIKSAYKAAVVEKSEFGQKWEDHQNDYFIKMGIDLQVDSSGIIPQKHLGPVRMRARAFDLLDAHEQQMMANMVFCENGREVFLKLTDQRSIFDTKLVDNFIEKNVKFRSKQEEIKKEFWSQDEIIPLLDPQTKKHTGSFSTLALVKEERVLARLADKIYEQEGFKVKEKIAIKASLKETLNPEQKVAFENILKGKKLSCLQGFAGTGKGRVLSALRDAYTNAGYKVRGFGPDNATAEVLKGHKFGEAENIYRFTHAAHHGQRKIRRGREIWICDEASKLSNRPFIEFLKLATREKAQVIFCGDSKQIASINRGGLFVYLQEKFGSQKLKDIQRQKLEEQRYISKALATGSVGAAFNAIESMKGFRWSEFKKEAIEALFEEWSKGYFSNPQSNTLMIAHSNPIVNTLNELARITRKERGELSTQEEFSCETKLGRFYVGLGDKIQFRKKDFELGISNGLTGTLVKAKENKFTVLIDQGGRLERKVVFNPKKFKDFQLGYATSYFRSQGSTVDRCYVLDSPHLNKENFYVALTRHVKDVKYFVYKSSVKNLADLKVKATKDETKRCTLHYITNEDVELVKENQQRKVELKNLKQSDEFLHRVKGHFLGIKDSVGSGLGKRVQSFSDIKPDKKFFAPPPPDKETVNVDVHKIIGGWDNDSSAEALSDLKNDEFAESNLKNDEFAEFFKDLCGNERGAGQAEEKPKPSNLFEDMFEFKQGTGREDQKKNDGISECQGSMQGPKLDSSSRKEKGGRMLSDLVGSSKDKPLSERLLQKQAWSSLRSESQSALKGYFKLSKEASNLYQAVKTEAEFSKQSLESCSNYSNWKKICGKRNETAYQIAKEVDKKAAIKVLGEKSYKIVQDLAGRYEAVLERDSHRQQGHKDLKESLEGNVEALLYKLFPEGPTGKTSSQIRFGKKGSLCVNLSGSKAGLFYDHENQEGGDLLKLIQKAQGLDRQEAKEWAGSFLNIASDIQVPSIFEKRAQAKDQDLSWTSLKPPANTKPPSLKEVNPGLSYYYNEEGRHSYTDEKGQLLYQVLRLRSKQDPSAKMTPPLSFGRQEDGGKEPHWKIKGFKQESKRSLYNLKELFENPTKDVLVVEGEKTADKAMGKFPDKDLVCITWPGGSSAVLKANWSPLVGRRVIVWPDNDAAGVRAAEEVCDEMKKVGAREVYLVESKKLFEQLPKKWDLADKIPDKLKVKDLEDQLYKNKKEVLLDSVIGQSKVCKNSSTEEFKARNLLFHYEKRTAPILEKQLKLAKSYSQKEDLVWKYKHEALDFVDGASKIKKQISTDPMINAKGELAGNLATQILIFKAKNGKDPTVREINIMKQVMGQLEKEWRGKVEMKLDKGTLSLAKDVVFEKYCEKALMGRKIEKQDLKISAGEIVGKAEQITQRLGVQENCKELKQQRSIENHQQLGPGIEY